MQVRNEITNIFGESVTVTVTSITHIKFRIITSGLQSRRFKSSRLSIKPLTISSEAEDLEVWCLL